MRRSISILIASSTPFFAVAAFAFGLSSVPAAAQNYGDSYDNSGPPETVEVIAPRYRYHPPRGEHGGDIVNVSFSSRVPTEDLDLRSSWGAHILRARVRSTATALCQQLDSRYPVTVEGSPPCYEAAVERGMEQADAAIAQARNERD